MASSGSKRCLMQAKERINFMLPEGVEPGFQSVASATGRPASMSLRAGA